jgi:transcriptional regulator with XRE-family HTH domain
MSVVTLVVSKVPETDVEDLRSYFLRISCQKNITLQQIVDRAETVGIDIEPDTLEKLINGVLRNPTIDTLKGIAKGLEEPIADVLAAALQLEQEPPLPRQVTLRQILWDKVEENAKRYQRTVNEQLTEILTEYFHLRNEVANHYTENCDNSGFGFLIKPESDTQKLINPIKVSEKLKELGHEIPAQTVLMVLSKMNQDIDAEIVRVTVSIARQMYPDIVEVTE